jgi:putative NIF3 family GTP cyclohydrolase 1 type 2
LQNCDAYISGEVSERTFYEAKELGVHYFACGHHATTEAYFLNALLFCWQMNHFKIKTVLKLCFKLIYRKMHTQLWATM